MRPEAGSEARAPLANVSHDAAALPGTLPEPARALGTHENEGDSDGDRSTIPAPSPASVLGRLRDNVWMPIVAKGAGVALGMMALAGIGVWSTLSGVGVPLALASGAPPAAAPASGAPSPTRGASAPSASSAPSAPSVTPAPTAPTPSASTAPSNGAPPGAGIAADGRVILNLATVEELTRLPRVGPKRAQSILELRQKLGKFRQATDLLRVKGIGRKTLQLMLPKLLLNADAPKPPEVTPVR
jgi:competence protein ComEA